MTTKAEEVLYDLTCKDVGNIIYQYKLEFEQFERLNNTMKKLRYCNNIDRKNQFTRSNYGVSVRDFINYYNEQNKDCPARFRIELEERYDDLKSVFTETDLRFPDELDTLTKYNLFGDKIISGFTYKGQWHIFDTPHNHYTSLLTRTFNVNGPMIKIHTLSLVNDGLKNRIKRKIQLRLERLYRNFL